MTSFGQCNGNECVWYQYFGGSRTIGRPRFRERMPSRHLQAVLVANFLRCSTDISWDRASSDGQTHVSIHCSAAFLPLGFLPLYCIGCSPPPGTRSQGLSNCWYRDFSL